MKQKVATTISQLTRDKPAFMHFDLTGFIRLGTNAESCLININSMLNDVQSNGGNVLIPTYSYSYTSNELYSVRDSMSTLGHSSEFLREKNYSIRTYDPIFSYLSFASLTPNKHFTNTDSNTFGSGSIIDEVFQNDGYLISVGDRLHYSTEIHYIERLLKVPYRFEKDFHGEIIGLDGVKKRQKATYYCRDLEFAKRHNMTVSFEKLVYDLKQEGYVESVTIDDMLLIEIVRFQDLLPFIKRKLEKDDFYLMKPNRRVSKNSLQLNSHT